LIRQLDVAPTVAALLGVSLDQAVGFAVPGVLEHGAAGGGIGPGSGAR
jgi:hypothetical protein